MKIAIYGAGAIGGLLGARPGEGGARGNLNARGASLDAQRARGPTPLLPKAMSVYSWT